MAAVDNFEFSKNHRIRIQNSGIFWTIHNFGKNISVEIVERVQDSNKYVLGITFTSHPNEHNYVPTL